MSARSAAAIRRFQRSIVALLVVADIVLALLVSGRFFLRADLSRNGMYSLSATTKTMVAGLPEPLTVTYYVSDALRTRSAFPSQIEDLLNEYATWSRGRVTVESVDPSKTGRAGNVQSLGLSARQMQVVNNDQVNLATVYSGVVLSYLGRTAALPFVSDITTLEYDLSSQIRSLVDNRPRIIGVVVGDARLSLAQDYRYFQQEMGFQYQLQEVRRGDDVPADISVLFVLGTHDMSDTATYKVDQFIMRGGRAFLAVDPIDIDLSAGLAATANTTTAVEDALSAYGVRALPELVLDTLHQRMSYRMGQGSYVFADYPLWVSVSPRNVNPAHLITAHFPGLDLYWPSPLEMVARDGVQESVLASTSPNAWTMAGRLETNPEIVQTLRGPSSGGSSGQKALAVALTGTFTSAYAGRQAPKMEGKSAAKAFVSRSIATRLIVVGDVFFASDSIQYTQAEYNLSFLSNCAEWLSQGDDLLAIKTRAQGDTRLDKVTDPNQKVFLMNRSMVISIAVMPIVVIVVGGIRLVRRKRRTHPREAS